MSTLPATTTLGAVSLTVSDLERSLAFYTSRLGLQLQRRERGSALLGSPDAELLQLVEQRNAPPPPARRSGLYHFAILLPSRAELARVLRRLLESQTPLQGAADHLVSEALYLADPDGNGIELYRDRPRHEWPRRNGQLQMATDPLDVESLLATLPAAAALGQPLPAGTTIGHVHLHVGDLQAAESFYRQLLGFELVLRYGAAASFLAAGGYHHHIGLNTWAGVGAPPPPEGTTGLRWYSIRLPAAADVESVLVRVREAGVAVAERPQGFLLHDPAQNGILLTTP